MKKLLLLGGSRFLLPVIEAAHSLGCQAITCDYLPDNDAHKFADEYHNVSTTDREAVLALARELQVDGIMSFACDSGVDTAAYVAEQLGLPSVGSSAAVDILQHKARFRQFLADNGFNVPMARGYRCAEDAVSQAGDFHWPVIIKPTDSAGSKGVTQVTRAEDIPAAAEYAKQFSKTKTFIMEEFIEKQGCSSDSDCFSIDGKLVFCSFSSQRFDDEAANPYTPSAYSWPSDMPRAVQEALRGELQRLIALLGLKTSLYNIETRLGVDGKPYIMEVSPRGGGNRIAEVLRIAADTDLITNAVRAAVGMPVEGIHGDPVYSGSWAEVILHSEKSGVFKALEIDPAFETSHVVQKDLWVKPGDKIREFTGANCMIGTLVLRFDNEAQLVDHMGHLSDYIRVTLA